MFWARFGDRIRTDLVILNSNPDAPRGGVDSIVIHQLYSDILPQFVRPYNIFIHDNASVHIARIIRELLDDLNVEVMQWPPYSPDLNPIENL